MRVKVGDTSDDGFLSKEVRSRLRSVCCSREASLVARYSDWSLPLVRIPRCCPHGAGCHAPRGRTTTGGWRGTTRWCQELAAVLARLQESHRQYPDEGAKLAEHVEKVFIGLTGSSTP